MALLLTGTQDHALMAMVIQEAHKTAKRHGGFVGRTAVQKIMYFLKAIGVPMGYSFDIYHYGPFCQEILRDTEWLEADEVIADKSPQRQEYSDYAPEKALDELLKRHSRALEPYREKVQALVQTLIPLRPERLELLATIDYIYRQQLASGGNGPWKASVVSKFLGIKGDKFRQQEVEEIYDAMAEAGLVER